MSQVCGFPKKHQYTKKSSKSINSVGGQAELILLSWIEPILLMNEMLILLSFENGKKTLFLKLLKIVYEVYKIKTTQRRNV